MADHKIRKHSKFSASGAERWFACPGSVMLSEGVPDQTSPWAEEGTKAHEILEQVLREEWLSEDGAQDKIEMVEHARAAAKFIGDVHRKADKGYAELWVETRIHLDFIHEDMFGTFDSAVIAPFHQLHVFDYKYGRSLVTPERNLQMIFYGLGLAHKYDWNFKEVFLWIIQPRASGYCGPVFWRVGMEELKSYIPKFQSAVTRALLPQPEYKEGKHCHYCKAKHLCPIKKDQKQKEAQNIFNLLREKP